MNTSVIDLGSNGVMSCSIKDEDVTCVQSTDTIPVVREARSFLNMIKTCDLLDNTSNEKVNENACETFVAKVLKEDEPTWDTLFKKRTVSLHDTHPCKWKPGKIDKSGRLVKFGVCLPNRDEVKNVAFNARYEG